MTRLSIAARTAPPAWSGSHGLAVATLVSWLVAEGLGAWMLRRWIVAGRRRRPGRPGAAPAASAPVIFGHAGLALTGLTSWIVFLVTRADPAAWLAIGVLAPAIGLGVSTVTTWTPYPVQRPADPGARVPPRPLLPEDAALRRALVNEVLTGQLVDDLLASMLAEPAKPPGARWRLAPLIPVLHGVAAIATFLLAVLAAIAAISS